MKKEVGATSRKGVEHPSVPKQSVTWTDEDLSRLLALNLRVCQWVKPAETVRLYGITQRPSAMRMRKDGSAVGHQFQEEIARMPELSAEQCAFLYDVIKRVLDGERDAFKAAGSRSPTAILAILEPPSWRRTTNSREGSCPRRCRSVSATRSPTDTV
jgi:hypothetical protein